MRVGNPHLTQSKLQVVNGKNRVEVAASTRNKHWLASTVWLTVIAILINF
jgi:hypothetical protein